MSDETKPDWNERYRQGDTPWDSGIRSRELDRVLDVESIAPCRAVELGCGTGTNAVYLASRGFDVTAIECSPLALEKARQQAKAADVHVTFIQADLSDLHLELDPFDFVFDRGCYHVVRRTNLDGFLESLVRLTRPGTLYLMLAGNANEQSEDGPPRVHEHEIRADLGGLFEFQWIREMRFEDAGGVEGPLGWSCLMTRRSA